jgi:hypothetical protein
MWSQESVSEAAAAAAEWPLHEAELCLQERVRNSNISCQVRELPQTQQTTHNGGPG